MNIATMDDKPVFLLVIAGRQQKDALLSAFVDAGAQLVHTIYGKGTVNASYLEKMFGFVPEENKAVISCLVKSQKATEIMKMLVDRFDFEKPNTGVAFTIPIEGLSF